MFCENCGARIEDGDRFCGECGWSVPEPETERMPVTELPTQPIPQPEQAMGAPRFCLECGEPIEPGMGFCMSCGTPVGQVASDPDPVEASIPVTTPHGGATKKQRTWPLVVGGILIALVVVAVGAVGLSYAGIIDLPLPSFGAAQEEQGSAVEDEPVADDEDAVASDTDDADADDTDADVDDANADADADDADDTDTDATGSSSTGSSSGTADDEQIVSSLAGLSFDEKIEKIREVYYDTQGRLEDFDVTTGSDGIECYRENGVLMKAVVPAGTYDSSTYAGADSYTANYYYDQNGVLLFVFVFDGSEEYRYYIDYEDGGYVCIRYIDDAGTTHDYEDALAVSSGFSDTSYFCELASKLS